MASGLFVWAEVQVCCNYWRASALAALVLLPLSIVGTAEVMHGLPPFTLASVCAETTTLTPLVRRARDPTSENDGTYAPIRQLWNVLCDLARTDLVFAPYYADRVWEKQYSAWNMVV